MRFLKKSVVIATTLTLTFSCVSLFASQKLKGKAKTLFRSAKVDNMKDETKDKALDKFTQVIEMNPDHVESLHYYSTLIWNKAMDESGEKQLELYIDYRNKVSHMVNVLTDPANQDDKKIKKLKKEHIADEDYIAKYEEETQKKKDDPEFVRTLAPKTSQTIGMCDNQIYSIAFKAFKNKEYDKTISVLNKLLELNSEYITAYNMLAKSYGKSGDLEGQNKVLEKWLEFQPDNKNALAILASYYYNKGDKTNPEDENIKIAEKRFKDILALEPDHGTANQYLGFILSDRGEKDAAKPHLAKALEADPKNHDLMYELADYSEKNGDIESSLNYYLKIIEIFKKDPFYFQKAVFLAKDLKDYPKMLAASEMWYETFQDMESAEWAYTAAHFAKDEVKKAKYGKIIGQ